MILLKTRALRVTVLLVLKKKNSFQEKSDNSLFIRCSSYKWRVTKNAELRKSGELRIATPTFRNSPLIFKLMNGELREVLTIHLYCLIRNGELLEVLTIFLRSQ